VPLIKLDEVKIESPRLDRRIDILAHVDVADRHHVLVCEVKSSGQPRHVREALLQLRNYAAHWGEEATLIFMAPYLSPEAQALCKEEGVGFLDLEGNARLVFDGVFVERLFSSKPSVEKRELKSLFRPKSAQVLRVMLRDPRRAWGVTELAETAGVGLGHVSNVRTGLLDREMGPGLGQGTFHLRTLCAAECLARRLRAAGRRTHGFLYFSSRPFL